jgi:polyhydroxyalkanoate synthesis regulator phasin
MNAVLQLEADAAMYGVVRSTDRDGRKHFIATCAQCNRQQNTFNSTFDHVDEILSHFRKQGWVFDYKVSPYCTTQCQRSAKKAKQIEDREKRKIEEMNHKPQAPPAPPPLPPVVATPSIGTHPKIARRVITLLNENFDCDKRLYHPGWSDELVAKEADAALVFVVKYREDAYAKLAEEPMVTKIREDIKALEDLQAQHCAEINGKIEELKARLDKLTGVHHKAQG